MILDPNWDIFQSVTAQKRLRLLLAFLVALKVLKMCFEVSFNQNILTTNLVNNFQMNVSLPSNFILIPPEF